MTNRFAREEMLAGRLPGTAPALRMRLVAANDNQAPVGYLLRRAATAFGLLGLLAATWLLAR